MTAHAHYLCNFCQQEDEVIIRDGIIQCAACGSTDVDSDTDVDNTLEDLFEERVERADENDII